MKFMFKMLTLALLLSSRLAYADCIVQAEKPLTCSIVAVTDGDTIKLNIPSLPKEMQFSVRVYGIDTPEKKARAKCNKEAALAERASKFSLKLISHAQDITFSNIKRDKFGGRYLAEVDLDGVSLGRSLITAGLARPYHGEKKKSWCE